MGGVVKSVKKVVNAIVDAIVKVVKAIVSALEKIVKEIRKVLASCMIIMGILILILAILCLFMPALLPLLMSAISTYTTVFAGMSVSGLFAMGFVLVGGAFLVDDEAAGAMLNKVGKALGQAAGGIAEVAGDVIGSIIGGIGNSSLGGGLKILALACGTYFGLKILSGSGDDKDDSTILIETSLDDSKQQQSEDSTNVKGN